MRPRNQILISLDMYRKVSLISLVRKRGACGSRRWILKSHHYEKSQVPQDLLEGSQEGRFTSWFAILILLVLFVKETHDFLSPRQVYDLSLDRTSSPKIQVNFNVSLLDLRCDYATINVVSVLGDEQNVTKAITRRALDQEGTRNDALGHIHHHAEKPPVMMHDPSITESLDELHKNGKDVVSLDQETLQYALDEKEYVFVKYYADWCSHCRVFAPSKTR